MGSGVGSREDPNNFKAGEQTGASTHGAHWPHCFLDDPRIWGYVSLGFWAPPSLHFWALQALFGICSKALSFLREVIWPSNSELDCSWRNVPAFSLTPVWKWTVPFGTVLLFGPCPFRTSHETVLSLPSNSCLETDCSCWMELCWPLVHTYLFVARQLHLGRSHPVH